MREIPPTECPKCKQPLVVKNDYIGGGSHYYELACVGCRVNFTFDTYRFKLEPTMQPKIYCIYHRADFDGIFCYRIAKRFFDAHKYDVEYIGWDYGDPVPNIEPDAGVYMLDISVDGLMDHPNLNWVDHHKSAIDKYPKTIQGYRIDGVAACRLAWQYFGGINGWQKSNTPTKEDFVEHLVTEPFAVRLAGEYDIWDRRDPRAELFQHGLRSQGLTEDVWSQLLDPQATIGFSAMTQKLLMQGRVVQFSKEQENAEITNRRSFTVVFEGREFLALNTARCNSLTFAAKDTQESSHEALMGFYWNGETWTVSLYHAAHRKDIDLSLIAVKYGGGGHRGACGFRAAKLPFLP